MPKQTIEYMHAPISSKLLFVVMLQHSHLGEIAGTGRSFNDFNIDDNGWFSLWNLRFRRCIPGILCRGLYCKFHQNPELAELLLMTGDFELIEAAATDRSCGIGYHAAFARAKKEKWGDNLPGKALMEMPKTLRGKYLGSVDPVPYAFKFWRSWEERCKNGRANS